MEKWTRLLRCRPVEAPCKLVYSLHHLSRIAFLSCICAASMADPGAAALPPWLLNLPAAFRDMISHRWRSATTSQGSRRIGAGETGDGRDDDGSRFFDANSRVWQRYPKVARYNPPPPTLPLPFKYYGQPFYKGFAWETKV